MLTSLHIKPILRQNAILLFFFLLSLSLMAQQEYRFEHISKSEGLSQGTINAIFEDNNGLMWFGTNDGLNLYDGTKIEVFRRNFEDPQSIPNNHILAINQDKKGRLWVGTFGNDLCYLDPVTENFYPWQEYIENYVVTDIGDKIFCIDINQKTNELLAGSDKGILIIDLDKKKMRFLDMQNFMVDSIRVGNIYSLLAEDENIWIGTGFGGLIHYDGKSQKFTPIGYDHERSNLTASINKGTIFDIIKDKTATIWVATFGDFVLKLDRQKNLLSRVDFEQQSPIFHELAYTRNITLVGDTAIWATTEYGFQVFDLKSRKIYNTRYNADNPFGVSSSSLKTIFADSKGGVWIGGNGYGLNYYFPVSKGFRNLTCQPGQKKSLDFRSVRTIYVDENQNLFVGGYGGMNAFDKAGNLIWRKPELDVAYVSYPDMQNENYLWVGRENGGLILVDKKQGNFVHNFDNNQEHIKDKISGNFITSLLPKSKNELWVGTETGLNLFNTETFKSQFFQHDPENKISVPNGKIRDIFKDSKGRTWLASFGGGVAYMKNDDMLFRTFKNDPKDPKSISSNNVYCVHESLTGDIYIGTESGLNRFDEITQTFAHLNTSNGLVNDVVYRIENDLLGRLWISTNEGLSCFDPTKKTFRNYDQEDGLQANEFNSNASFVDQNGTMYFGGIDGVTIFDPLSLKDNINPPKIIFTNLTICNKKAIIDPPITQAKNVCLNYHNQAFKLEFAALNFYKAHKNQYAYRIKEINQEWQMLGNKNSIEIIHLGFGTFTIEVKASNNDNYWSPDPAQLIISIPPPFWAAKWFIFISIVGFLILLFTLYRLRIRNLEKNKRLLEKEINLRTHELQVANSNLKSEIKIRQQTEEELQIANRTKDRFFSIIAHDLKNPIGVLLGLAEMLKTEYDDLDQKEKKEMIDAMFKSAADNYKLLENLLSWARSQQNRLNLNIHEFDLFEVIQENISFLAEQAKTKKIKFKTELSANIIVLADYQTISTVVRNLLSNAIKFTHNGGTIQIGIKKNQDTVTLNITDNGIGIDQENIEKLFRIDEQFKRPGTMNEKGTGLGLILCKEFVEANYGSISVKSEAGKGSTFSITLPSGNA
jgi:signal transduction histidine kinase/ligand-binding sensor domain-containing protein